MREFETYVERSLSKSTRIAALIAGVILIVLGITVPSFYSILVGAVLMIAMLFDKKVVLNEEGLITKYTFMMAPFYQEKWTFDEITDLHKEKAKDPKLAIVHFGKGALAKRIIFYSKDLDEIMDLAHEKNSKINFGDDVN